MPLTDADRTRVWSEWMRENTQQTPVTKPALRAAINAVDDWLDANAPSLNAVLVASGGGSLTARQKAHLVLAVARIRMEKS